MMLICEGFMSLTAPDGQPNIFTLASFFFLQGLLEALRAQMNVELNAPLLSFVSMKTLVEIHHSKSDILPIGAM